jgi:hypothetical protein
MKRAKFYVGARNKDGKKEVFKSVETPTQTSHGHRYGYSIGAFRTKRAAEYMRDNPMCQTVHEAEAKAKVLAKK